MSRHFALSDLHGNYNLWKQIKSYLRADDVVYILGDVIDRGDDGITILQEIFADSRFTMLKGNHEDLLYKAERPDNEKSANFWYKNHQINGGFPTEEALHQLPLDEQNLLLDKINKLPCVKIYRNPQGKKILLTHSGSGKCHFGKYGLNSLLWDRTRCNENWMPLGFEDWYFVFGHTPVQTLSNLVHRDKNNIYAEGHKVDLDFGTPTTRKIALFNLDTFAIEKIFKEEC
jgi:serine/threonine protein phosphatase 1